MESADRKGHPYWAPIEISCRRIVPETGEGVDPRGGKQTAELFMKPRDGGITLALKVQSRVNAGFEFVVHLQGQWPVEGLQADCDRQSKEYKELVHGYRLDELTAVVNYELSVLASRFKAPSPFVKQEDLARLRGASLGEE